MSLPEQRNFSFQQGLDPNEKLGQSFTGTHPPRGGMDAPTWDAVHTIAGDLGARTTVFGSWGATDNDRQQLIAHLGKKTLQGSPTRDFKTAWRKDKDGNTVPKLYRVDTHAMRRCQYVVLAHKQRSAVIVLDIDHRGQRGGHVENNYPEVYTKLVALSAGNLGPSWIGANPVNGKCQLIWMIDPVYADERADSSSIPQAMRGVDNWPCHIVGRGRDSGRCRGWVLVCLAMR